MTAVTASPRPSDRVHDDRAGIFLPSAVMTAPIPYASTWFGCLVFV